MSKVHRAVIAIILVLFLLPCQASFALNTVETRTVRVGYYHIEGFHVIDEHGVRSGYGYEVLQAMKLYNNWMYKYIGYEKGWADIQQMLQNGEIDMVISAVKTPEREAIYDFSERPVSQSGACLMVRAGESPYVAGQYDGYNGMRIGFIENSSQIASTAAFAAEKGFTYTPVYYKTSGELEKAIMNGSNVDAIVTSNMRIIAGTRRLDLFAMQNVYAIVQKGNTALLQEINYALEQISLYNSGIYEKLYGKYYTADSGDKVFFSPEERAFIETFQASGEPLRVTFVPQMAPYAYYDGDMPAGILYEIATEILRRTGLATQLIPIKTEAEYHNMVKNGEIDLRLTARFDYNYAENMGYTLTDPYYGTDVSRITRKDGSEVIHTIATVRDSLIETHYLPTILRDEQVVCFNSLEECAAAVRNGQCDALYLYTRTAQAVVFADETNRLTSVVMPRYKAQFSIGVRENVDARLASILEKASASLSEDDIAKIVLKYTDHGTQTVTLRQLLYTNPILFLSIVALLLILLFCAVMYLFLSRKRKQERKQNQQLQSALSSAKQANAAKSMFMSRMSHEIRTPLNAIIGYNSISSTTLANAKNEADYRHAAMKTMDCLAKSDIASKHLLTVINDVLDMAAIESGKIKIAHDPFDFKGMISALTIMFFPQAKAKNVDLEVVFDTPTEEWFVGDQMRVNQILTNLLSNAVKFTPAGGKIHFSISQAETTETTAQIRFSVSDTGIGMSDTFLRTIWTPFEQADASISRRFGGTGLGLSISKNLIDLMGGSIRVESAENAGTTFFAEIPLTRTEQPVKDELYDFSGIRVLIVDDDISTCDYLKLLLRRFGVDCTAVTSGKAAIAAVQDSVKEKRHFTLCMIDWCMPEMNGLETAHEIRRLAGESVPIIVISAYDVSEIEDDARAAGVNSFAAKPLFQSTVFDLLADICGRPRVAKLTKSNTPNFGGARILLAEDNKMNMEIAKALLASWNILVDEAFNGQEAVDKFCAAPAGTYKTILMDVHMPEMDGYRATQTIRASQHKEATTIPIVAMTADVFAEDIAEALAAGMNGHIGKPIDRDLLLETLRKYCSDTQQNE